MVVPPVLRPYQSAAIQKLREKLRAGAKRLVLIAPTGSGKTVMGADMIRTALLKGSRALFLAHRKELIDQTHKKLAQFGVSAGVIMAGDKRADSWLPVQVASVQTLVRRLERKPDAQIIIVDECHHCMSDTYVKILETYPNAIVIGLTATPWRSDKVGLGDLYQDHVLACTPAELIASGALINYDGFAYDAPDLHEVKITAGDFNQKQLGLACNTKILVGNVTKEYREHAPGKPAIVFPVNIEHSEHLVAEFEADGFKAAHVDCYTKASLREERINAFKEGRLTILSSVGVLTEGWDAPNAEVCILARPTKSLTLYLQMVGRTLRPSPETGKQRALIHDHSGNMLRHGLPDDDRDYSLGSTPDRVIAARTCPACYAVFNRTNKGRCPNCNELIGEYKPRSDQGERNDKIFVEGKRISKAEIERMRERRAELGLTRPLTDHQLAMVSSASRSQKAAEYLRLEQVRANKNFQKGFVAQQFRQTFGHWPRFEQHELTVQPASQPFLPLERKKA